MAEDREVPRFSRRGIIKGIAAVTAWDAALALPSQGEGRPVVVTTHGKVRGVRMGRVHYYRGVPYGAAVGGKGRFLPPSPPTPWNDVRDAAAYGQRAPQPPGPPGMMPGANQPMGEECLVLNVCTPAPDAARRPVMVWLHPGGFGAGSDYTGQGTLSVKEDVVLVEVNHRLGIFGFLHLAAYEERFALSGVAGMLDIVAALEWVRDNIAAFGGDPGNVTIFGESGGGAKVSALMAMPAATMLFDMPSRTENDPAAEDRRPLDILSIG